MNIHRRDFVVGSVKASMSLLLLDALPLRSLGQGASIPTPPLPAVDYTVLGIADYLTRYTPPTGNFPSSGPWTATYQMLEWEGAPHRKPGRNQPMGTYALTRRAPGADGAITYDLDYSILLYGWESGLKSTMQCSNEPLPRLLSWHTDYEKHPTEIAEAPWTLSEDGQVKDGTMTITSKAGTRRFPTSRPVVTQFALLDALRTAKADPADPLANTEFDWLCDLTSFRPGHKLRPCAQLDLTVGSQSYQLHGFLQTGRGSVPVNYWVDTAGRPLFVTGGLLFSVLTSVQPA